MKKNNEKIRLIVLLVISIAVIATGSLFSLGSLNEGDMTGAILGGIIAVTIVLFAMKVFVRGNKDMRNGFPLHDERSQKVLERASSKAFYVSLYILLGIGFLSDVITFRDVSQATGITVGIMAIVFAIFWAYYNGREI